MAKDYEKQLKLLRKQASDSEREKVQYETRKEEALKRKAEVEKKCAAMNIDPTQIPEEVKKLEDEVEDILTKVAKYFPEGEDDEAAF